MRSVIRKLYTRWQSVSHWVSHPVIWNVWEGWFAPYYVMRGAIVNLLYHDWATPANYGPQRPCENWRNSDPHPIRDALFTGSWIYPHHYIFRIPPYVNVSSSPFMSSCKSVHLSRFYFLFKGGIGRVRGGTEAKKDDKGRKHNMRSFERDLLFWGETGGNAAPICVWLESFYMFCMALNTTWCFARFILGGDATVSLHPPHNYSIDIALASRLHLAWGSVLIYVYTMIWYDMTWYT